MKDFIFSPSGWTVISILLIAGLLAYLYWGKLLALWGKIAKETGIPEKLKWSEWKDKINFTNVVWGVFILFWIFMLYLLGVFIYHFYHLPIPKTDDCSCGDGFDLYMTFIYILGGIWTLIAVIMFFSNEFDSLWEMLWVYLLGVICIVVAISIVAMLFLSFKVGLVWVGSNIFSAVLATAFYRWDKQRPYKKKRK